MRKLVLLLSLISAVYCIKTRVIGGGNASPGELPFQVQILVQSSHYCGGSLVAAQWVLTAAHCVQDVDLSMMSVVAGQYNLEQIDGSEQIRQVVSAIMHPEYDPFSRVADIALIKVDSKFDIDEEFVAPLWIPREGDILPIESSASISGWGDENVNLAQILQKADLIVLSDEDCQFFYGQYYLPKMMCALGIPPSSTFCRGDNGGPLVGRNERNLSFLGGIISFGSQDFNQCIISGFPGIYTKVVDFSDWILELILTDSDERCQQDPITLTPDYTPKGNIIQIDGMDVYEAPIKSWDKVIVSVYDIYGFEPGTNNLYQIADLINEFGFQVVLPDFFRGIPWNKAHFPIPDSEEFKKFQRETSWEATVREDMIKVLNHYKSRGVTDFGVYGFCFGGKITYHASAEFPEIKMGGQVHPAQVQAEDALGIKSPMLLMPAANDFEMEDYCLRIIERLGADACHHHRFTDVNHGFSGGRSDWNNATVRGRAEEVVYLLRKEFCTHMG